MLRFFTVHNRAASPRRVRRWLLPVLLVAGSTSHAGDAAPETQTLHLFTEPFPPFSMTVNGATYAATADQVTGFAAETFKALMQRANVPATMQLVPWKRAYAQALENPHHGVFPTFRTPEREALFQWVGPLVENNWVLMARADSPIELASLAEAGKYRIGAYLGDSLAEYLESQGLALDYVTNDVLNVRKLGRGRIDLWPVVQTAATPPLAVQEGVAVREVFTFKRTAMALALHRSTDPALIARLQRTLQSMHADGTVARLESRFSGAQEAAQEAVDTSSMNSPSSSDAASPGSDIASSSMSE